MKGQDISACLQRRPSGLALGSSTQNNDLDTSCKLEQSLGRSRCHQSSTKGRVSIQTSDPKLLQSLLRLEQDAISQRKAVLAFQSRVLVSQPTKEFLDEIRAHRKELTTTLAAVTVLWFRHNSMPMRLQEGLKRNLQKSIKDIDDLKHSLIDTPATRTAIIRAQQPGEYRSHECPMYTILMWVIDRDFVRSLEECNSLLQRSLFQVLVQDSLGHSTRKKNNFSLQSLKDDFRKTMGNNLSPADEICLRSFPSDVRTARKLLGVPKTMTYACCPTCSALYPPQDEDGVPMYPFTCISEPCRGCDLLKLGSTPDGKSVGVPKRPFMMQDFDDFVARLLSRPGMEAAIQRSREHVHNETVHDIINADGIRTIKGPDGIPFLSGGQQNELRLLWCLSVDFFNPYHNKIAGKVASVGSIVLSCLMLPPDMRHKPENLCLVGIIPGPREPSGKEIDHFLRPLVNIMKASWTHGTTYSTHNYPHGRLVRSAIALSVNDLPMARKIMGLANYVDRKAAKEESTSSIQPRTLQTVREHAHKWKSATTQKERKHLYDKTGVRHSVLMELDYWDPTTMVPVDGMHLLFIGLLQYHARTVLGMDSVSTRNPNVTKITTKQLEDARKMLLCTGTKPLDLKALKLDVLKVLCEEMGIDVKQPRKNRKDDLIESLKVRRISTLHTVPCHIGSHS